MRYQKKILASLSGLQQDIPPIWMMRQAGRYLPEYRAVRQNLGGFLDLCYSPKDACEVTLQPIRRFDFDAAILFSDILVVPHALGQKIWFVENEGPRLEPIQTPKDIDVLNRIDFQKKISPIYETVERIKTDLPKSCALIGFAGSPWTVATYMIEGGSSRDFSKVKKWAFENPKSFKKLLSLLADVTAEYLINQVKSGVEVIQLFDSWAGIAAGNYFTQWIIQPTQQLIKNVRLIYPDVPIIGFPKGAGLYYDAYVNQTSVNAIGLDTTLPLDYVRDKLQKICPVQGNLDPIMLLTGGTVMHQQIKLILDHLGSGPFIFNLGHGIVKETPIDHVIDLISTIREQKYR